MLGPKAYSLSGEFNGGVVGGEYGRLYIRNGPDKGKSVTLAELGLGIGFDASAGGIATTYYYTGSSKNFTLNLFNGANFQIGGSISIFSGSISRAVVQGGTIWGASIGVSIRNPISVGGYGTR